jgi:hypothetical protein
VPLPVNLQDVLEEMQTVSDEMTAYINRKTGELIQFISFIHVRST